MRSTGVIAYKDKWLVEASYDMTLNEQRLMLTCVGMLNPREPVPDEITIHAADLLRHFPDIGETNVARELSKAVNKLWDRSIIVRDPSQEKEFRWIDSRVKYFKGEARATISFSPAVKKYLSEFSGVFAKIALENVSGLQSAYSLRLYEMCMQFIKAGNRLITIEEFRFMMATKDKYKDFRDMKKRVIEPAVAEINEKTNLDITVAKLRKHGRSYSHLHFIFKEKEQLSLPI